jgi:hypothetical protein
MPRLLFGAADGEGIGIDLPESAQGRDGWFDAPVEVKVSGFVGSISAYFEVDDFVEFRKSLISLYQTLAGTADLSHRERQVSLSLRGNGRGAVEVRGFAYAHPTHGSKLDFEFKIDQTFLAEPIRVLDRFMELHGGADVPPRLTSSWSGR